MDSIAQDNIASLRQGIMLLAELGDARYAQPVPQCFNSRIGGHVRHNVDHYFSFLEGYQQGCVDYDARKRDPRIENDTAYANDCMLRIADLLENVQQADLEKPLQVKMDCNSLAEDVQPWSHSTVRRELQFLLSHTIHHYALISVMCQLIGFQPAADFGVAPSTLRYQRAQVSS